MGNWLGYQERTILRLAARNIRQHREKTFIIGGLTVVIVFIFVLGNSVFQTGRKGLHSSFVDNFTGDVMITQDSKGAYMSLFGRFQDGAAFMHDEPDKVMDGPVGKIRNYPALEEYLRGRKEIERSASLANGRALTSIGNSANSFVLFFGIDPASYSRMFPGSMRMVRGKYLADGETGLLVSEATLASLSKDLGRPVDVGDKLMLKGFSQKGFRMREIPIAGVYAFTFPSDKLQQYCFLDIQSVRYLNGYVVGHDETVKLSADDDSLFAMGDMDKLFSSKQEANGTFEAGRQTAEDLRAIVGDKSARDAANAIQGGSWQFVLLKTAPGVDPDRFIKELNRDFEKRGLDVRAHGWKQAAGPFAAFPLVMQSVFNAALAFILAVSIIIIVNTIVISLSERVGEIGTMRSLGSRRGFVRKLFYSELGITLFGFGAIGFAAALAFILICNLSGGIPIPPNPMAEVILGGKRIVLSVPFGMAYTLPILLTAITFLSGWLPVNYAVRISPIEAMRRN
jgi:putative ABC transport system permease protein